MATWRTTRSGSFDLPLPRAQAAALFTARGEKLWVPGWDPEFFADVDDDTADGTVFRTRDDAGRATTWVVVDGESDERIRYVRVAEAGSAGTVEVTLADHGNGCRVTVVYDLTATSETGSEQLTEFAESYPTFLSSWRTAILAWLEAGAPAEG